MQMSKASWVMPPCLDQGTSHPFTPLTMRLLCSAFCYSVMSMTSSLCLILCRAMPNTAQYCLHKFSTKHTTSTSFVSVQPNHQWNLSTMHCMLLLYSDAIQLFARSLACFPHMLWAGSRTKATSCLCPILRSLLCSMIPTIDKPSLVLSLSASHPMNSQSTLSLIRLCTGKSAWTTSSQHQIQLRFPCMHS